ncbi:endoglucanase 4-like [Senna tora]|uniref:Endoglucanase 4-like n=1 Tax=Senna tora TaxID=362788 RepID=A0A834XGR2_9FABA|nr:endoglucanase 4-like [Senna tora]
MSLLFLLVVLIGGGMFGSGVVAHDYSGALSNSILFFEGQRSGVLPQDLGVVLQLPLLHFIATHSQRLVASDDWIGPYDKTMQERSSFQEHFGFLQSSISQNELQLQNNQWFGGKGQFY